MTCSSLRRTRCGPPIDDARATEWSVGGDGLRSHLPTPPPPGTFHCQDKAVILPFKNGQNNILLQAEGKEQQDHLYKLFHGIWKFEQASSFLR